MSNLLNKEEKIVHLNQKQVPVKPVFVFRKESWGKLRLSQEKEKQAANFSWVEKKQLSPPHRCGIKPTWRKTVSVQSSRNKRALNQTTSSPWRQKSWNIQLSNKRSALSPFSFSNILSQACFKIFVLLPTLMTQHLVKYDPTLPL